ncbi:MAG TPA: SRPBCC family protein [Janthinobacterium sp.]|jgi:uncharacterized membrane protein|nr:SRPBCC family protein [Janthinobacterium sp.]
MQNKPEQQSKRRSRQGPWQFPTSTPTRNGAEGASQAQAALLQPPPQTRRPDDTGPARVGRGEQLATALGWLSIGIGVAHLLAPRAVARATGMPASPLLVRAIGLREMACGVGMLNQRTAPAWRWSRVAGDAMDLALLGASARAPDSRGGRLAATAAVVAGVTALDLVSSRRASAAAGTARLERSNVPVEKSVTVNRSADECYQFWRDVERLPRFMKHLESVRRIDERRSHWKAKGPAGVSVEWDAEITEDQPGRRLGWRSAEGADVDNDGAVEFTPASGGRGTVVKVRLRYAPPAGAVGAAAAKLFGEEPSLQIDEDLRRFKQLIETGEVATTDGQPSGLRSMTARLLNKGEPK